MVYLFIYLFVFKKKTFVCKSFLAQKRTKKPRKVSRFPTEPSAKQTNILNAGEKLEHGINCISFTQKKTKKKREKKKRKEKKRKAEGLTVAE